MSILRADRVLHKNIAANKGGKSTACPNQSHHAGPHGKSGTIRGRKTQPGLERRPKRVEPFIPSRASESVLPDMVQDRQVRCTDLDDVDSMTPVDIRLRPVDFVLRDPFWIATLHPPRVLCVPPWVLDLITEGNEILILAQLNYWFRPTDTDENKLRAQVVFGGHIWLAKTFADLGTEIGRNDRQVKKAVKALTNKGFVVIERHRSQHYRGGVVSHLRLDWPVIAAAHASATQNRKEVGHADDWR